LDRKYAHAKMEGRKKGLKKEKEKGHGRKAKLWT